jgi:hypothetical protein
MQLPQTGASALTRVRYARYTLRRLRRAKLDDLADACEHANRALLDADRAADDASMPVQDAIAERDLCDDALDSLARDVRHTLASRARDATTQEPYTRIFPEGVAHYTDATLDQEVERYELLVARMKTHLAANDALRGTVLTAIVDGIARYRDAAHALVAARNAEASASDALNAATERWTTQMERTYGALVQRDGRSAADRFFLSLAKPRAKKTERNGKTDTAPAAPAKNGASHGASRPSVAPPS